MKYPIIRPLFVSCLLLLVCFTTCPQSRADSATPPANLLTNGSMEYWHPSGLCPQAWGVWTPDPLRQSWNVQRSSKIHHDGHSAWQVNVTQWANAYSGAKVQAGKTYTFSIWVYCDKPVKLIMTLNLGGKNMDKSELAINRVKADYDITPDTWQRVHVTDTMPPGTETATTYLLLRGQGSWYFDQAMLNEGPLVDYVPGEHFDPVTPTGRQKQEGETAFTPAYWDAQLKQVDDQEVGFCFDSDIMSLYRLHENDAAVGVTFETPVRLRGLSMLLHEPALPQDVTVRVQIKQQGHWRDYEYKVVAVGPTTLLAFEPVHVQAIRIRFNFDAQGKRKVLRIYNIGLAQ